MSQKQFSAFISHSTKNASFANELAQSLEASGLTTWIAPRDIGLGKNFDIEILDGIEASKAFVLVLSEAANLSSHVRKEVEHATSHGTPILPVRVDQTLPSRKLEYFVKMYQWIDAWDGLTDDVVQKLVAAIKSDEEIGFVGGNLETDATQFFVPVKLSSGQRRISPPRVGEKWNPLVSKDTQKRVAQLQEKELATGDKMHKHIVRWGPPSGGDSIFFATDYSVYRLSNFAHVTKAASSKRLFLPHLLADFDFDPWDSLVVAGSGYLRKVSNTVHKNADLKNRLFHQEASYLRKHPNLKRMVHVYEGNSVSAGERIFIDVLSSPRDIGFRRTSIDKNFRIDEPKIEWSPTGNFIYFDGRMEHPRLFTLRKDDGDFKISQTIFRQYRVMAWHPKYDYMAGAFVTDTEASEAGIDILDIGTDGSFEVLQRIHTKQKDFINSISWSPTGQHIVCSSGDGTTAFIDLATLSVRTLYDTGEFAAFSPDGQRFLLNSRRKAQIFSCPGCEVLASFDGGVSGKVLKGSPWSNCGKKVILDTHCLAVAGME